MSFLKKLFGGEPQKPDWNQIERLMDLTTRLNRFDQEGLFTTSRWTEGPGGTWSQQMGVNESIMPAFESFLSRLNAPATPYSRPEQFGSLLDAKMANQMQRHNTLDPNFQLPQQNMFGPGVNEQMAMREEQNRLAQEAAREEAARAVEEMQEQQRQTRDQNRMFRQQSGGAFDPMKQSPYRIK